jgi:hypothetical protein
VPKHRLQNAGVERRGGGVVQEYPVGHDPF